MPIADVGPKIDPNSITYDGKVMKSMLRNGYKWLIWRWLFVWIVQQASSQCNQTTKNDQMIPKELQLEVQAASKQLNQAHYYLILPWVCFIIYYFELKI